MTGLRQRERKLCALIRELAALRGTYAVSVSYLTDYVYISIASYLSSSICVSLSYTCTDTRVHGT